MQAKTLLDKIEGDDPSWNQLRSLAKPLHNAYAVLQKSTADDTFFSSVLTHGLNNVKANMEATEFAKAVPRVLSYEGFVSDLQTQSQRVCSLHDLAQGK